MSRMAWMLAAALVAAPVAVVMAQDRDQAQDQDVVRISGSDVAVYDLAGRVEVVRGSGSDVVVRITRGGDDASKLRVETGDIGGRSTLRVIFPDDEIVYPELGRGSNSTISVRDDGTFGDGRMSLRANRVRIRGSGSGTEAWADLVVEVPAGRTVATYLGVGRIDANGVDGTVRLDTGSGRVHASDMSGSLVVDTGSGSVEVRGMDGRLSIDTGSGGVDVQDVTGERVDIDTGSGEVDVRGVQTQALMVDTGSGGVDLAGVSSPSVMVDTGSGGIDLELLTDVDALDLDTGSGSVTVRAPGNLGGDVDIDTGSGSIDLDFPVEISGRARRDRVRGTLGDGEGEIRIDTGSGSVRLLRGS
jgi:lia operon protein LiaG